MSNKKILQAFLTKRSMDKSSYIIATNYQQRWFVLDNDKLTYYDGKISRMGEQKGEIELKKILGVEEVEDHCLDRKANAFQVIHICPTRYDPVILYVVTTNKTEQQKWINAIRKGALNAGATFKKVYHPGVWTDGCFTCCHAQGRLSRGCKPMHTSVKEEQEHENQASDETFKKSSSTKSGRGDNGRTAPTRPPPSIPDQQVEASKIGHREHYSQRSAQKSSLTKKDSSRSQTSSNESSQIIRICVAKYSLNPASDADLELVEGERYEVLDESDVDWWKVRNKHGTSGYAPKNYLEEDASLDLYEWYYGGVSKEECASQITNDGRPGCFLVRDSREKGTFTLSLYDGASIRNFRIEATATGKVYIIKGKEFSSVPKLVEYYQRNEVGSTGCRLETTPM